MSSFYGGGGNNQPLIIDTKLFVAQESALPKEMKKDTLYFATDTKKIYIDTEEKGQLKRTLFSTLADRISVESGILTFHI